MGFNVSVPDWYKKSLRGFLEQLDRWHFSVLAFNWWSRKEGHRHRYANYSRPMKSNKRSTKIIRIYRDNHGSAFKGNNFIEGRSPHGAIWTSAIAKIDSGAKVAEVKAWKPCYLNFVMILKGFQTLTQLYAQTKECLLDEIQIDMSQVSWFDAEDSTWMK